MIRRWLQAMLAWFADRVGDRIAAKNAVWLAEIHQRLHTIEVKLAEEHAKTAGRALANVRDFGGLRMELVNLENRAQAALNDVADRLTRPLADVREKLSTVATHANIEGLNYQLGGVKDDVISMVVAHTAMHRDHLGVRADQHADALSALDAKVAHLAALVVGRDVARKLEGERGPREFTSEVRQ